MGESILHLEDEPFMGENAPKSMRAHVRESFALVKTVFVHWLCCWSHFSEGNHPEILKKHKSNPKNHKEIQKLSPRNPIFFRNPKTNMLKNPFFFTNLKQIVQKSRKLLWNKKSLMNPRCPCPSLPPPPPLCCHYPSPPHHRRQFFWEKNKTTLTY